MKNPEFVQEPTDVAVSPDGTIRVKLYPDDSMRVTVVRGTRYAVRQMWFDAHGGNVLLMPVPGTGVALGGQK